jgi:excisionase family DNA binding protein
MTWATIPSSALPWSPSVGELIVPFVRSVDVAPIICHPGKLCLAYLAMATSQLLTVPQVAEEFQVTAQTIRNWIEGGALPAAKIGRAYRVRREDVDEMLARAQADSASLATRRDLWAPETLGMPHRRADGERPASIWDDVGALPSKRS